MNRTSNLLQVCLLGGFELQSIDGRNAGPPGRKTRALMGCLALSAGKPWPREKLMALLWSDRGEDQARASLRQALAELRRALGEPSPLRTDHEAVSLVVTMAAVDALEFERLAKAGKLGEAAALYRGPLLDGHGVRDGAFEEWLRVERTRLHDLAIDVFDRLAASQSGDAAIETAQRLLHLDPAREETHRLLMRLYAAAGQRAQALRQYQRCRETLRRELQAEPDVETERVYRQIQDEATAQAAVASAPKPDPAPLPGVKPSIAVLPFENLSGDPEQAYFSDGITEDIITELSRYRSLLVFARNSVFQFRGPGADIAAVRQRLGARFVVEGSIRKIASRLRITAQLIDAASETHLWVERYDRDVGDVFALQDEIARTVAATVEGRVAAGGVEQLRRKPTASWAAYDYFLQGRDHVNRYQMAQAEPLLARAVELDPAYVHAHAWRAIALIGRYLFDRLPETLDQGFAAAERALSLDDNDASSHHAMAYACLRRRRLDLAGLHFDRAVSLNPNDINIVGDRANWLMYTGRLDEALSSLDAAMKRDPYPPSWVWEVRGLILFHQQRYDEAIVAFQRQGEGPSWTPALLAAAYAQAGRLDEARQEVANSLAIDPKASIGHFAAMAIYTDTALRDQLLDGLRKAGFPD
jgi:TolB-like protein/Tfp pilus assembly protein PilF